MPDALDDAYNEPLERVFRDALRDESGLKARLFGRLRQDFAGFVEYVATADPDEIEDRVDEGTEELKRASVDALRQADEEARSAVEDAHGQGYEAAAAAAGVAASELPDWTPDASDTDVYARAPFEGDIEAFVSSSIDEEVSYFEQDLKYVRKYVSEDKYAKAAAQVLARGDEEVVEMLAERGIDLNDFDTDDLLDRAAEVFQNTKTMGSPDIRGILEEMDIDELAERDPDLYRRVKAHGTDRLPRVMDEVAKDLSADSPAVKSVVWTLSTRHGSLHSSPDECDFLASQNAFDLGPGHYPPEKVPSHPHPNCVVPGTEIQGSCSRVLRGDYSGKVIEISTRSGNQLTVTPNHPIPTRNAGFIAARKIGEGMKLLSYRGDRDVRSPFVSGNVHHPPTRIEKAFHTVSKNTSRLSVEGAPEHLHGDGRRVNGDIDIVGVDGTLLRYLQALRGDGISKRLLVVAERYVTVLRSLLPRVGPADFLRMIHRLPAASLVGGFHKLLGSPLRLDTLPSEFASFAFGANINPAFFKAFSECLSGRLNFRRQPIKRLAALVAIRKLIKVWDLNPTLFGRAADLDITRFESPADRTCTDAEFVSDAIHGSPRDVFVDDVVNVQVKFHDGKVYDLETTKGYYIANNIMIGNCECSITTVTRDPDDWGSDEIETPSAPNVDEDAVRAVLEDVKERMPTGDGRTVTDRHVERVHEIIEKVTREVEQNPRGDA